MFNQRLRERGEDPDQHVGRQKLRSIDPELYREWKIGLTITLAFAASFLIFATVALIQAMPRGLVILVLLVILWSGRLSLIGQSIDIQDAMDPR